MNIPAAFPEAQTLRLHEGLDEYNALLAWAH